MTTTSDRQINTRAALEALERGYTAIPINDGTKRPLRSNWTHTRWDLTNTAQLIEEFEEAWRIGATGIGLVLGAASGGLVDIDLDYPKATLLRDYLLPRTPMRTGRVGHPGSHLWYRVKDPIPGTRQHKMPDKSISVELRSDGAQTVIPPSTWWPKDWDGKVTSTELYRWEGEPWGGELGPAEVDGRVLSTQVALLGLSCVLIEGWPAAGGRHEAYLALAGALLRFGHAGVHPFWEKNLPALIRALAAATRDDDGGEARVSEVMDTTLNRLRSGDKVIGLTALGEIIGAEKVDQIKRLTREVEVSAGHITSVDLPVVSDDPAPSSGSVQDWIEAASSQLDGLGLAERDPLAERALISTWLAVDLDPYLAGEVKVPEPTILRRNDGQGLFYEGRVNCLYGRSESAKTWVAVYACTQEIAHGSRVMYLDLEDEPLGTLSRLAALGLGADDVRHQFTYIRPEDPHSAMQKNRWGQETPSEKGLKNAVVFEREIERVDPSLIVVDGMTVLYGLHGLDTNDATSTDIITAWLKRLTRNGRSTVIIIDHTTKGAERGSTPFGSQHKLAMVQGTALQVHPIDQPVPGSVGKVELLVGKDRPGQVRRISTKAKPPVAATVTLDSLVDGITKVTIEPPDPDEVVVGDSDAMEAKLNKYAQVSDAVIEVFHGDTTVKMTRKAIQLAVPHPARTVSEVVDLLVGRGALLMFSNNRWARYGLPPVP